MNFIVNAPALMQRLVADVAETPVDVEPYRRNRDALLKVLRDAGVLDSEKLGKEVFYWVDKTFLQESLEAVVAYIRKRV